MSIPVNTIISAILKALPGLAALIAAFRGNKPEPTQDDIAEKAKNEIEELESWKKAAKSERPGS